MWLLDLCNSNASGDAPAVSVSSISKREVADDMLIEVINALNTQWFVAVAIHTSVLHPVGVRCTICNLDQSRTSQRHCAISSRHGGSRPG